MRIDLFDLFRPSLDQMMYEHRRINKLYPFAKFSWRKVSPGHVTVSIDLPFVLPIPIGRP